MSNKFDFYMEAVESGTYHGYEKDPEIFAKDKAAAKEAENTAIENIAGGGTPPEKAGIIKVVKEPGLYKTALINLYKRGKGINTPVKYVEIVKELLKVTGERMNKKIEYNYKWHRGFGATNLCGRSTYGPGILHTVFDKVDGGYKFKDSSIKAIEDGSFKPFKGVLEPGKSDAAANNRRFAKRIKEREKKEEAAREAASFES